MDNEFILQDRLQKIRQIISEYGEENFYISFSGGKDSTVLSTLIDMSLPDNKIPRVFADTGIEMNMIRDFVYNIQKNDERVIIIKPTNNVRDILNKYGYPFKNKEHSCIINRYKRLGKTKSVKQYLGERPDGKEPWSSIKSCPKCLKYNFTEEFNLNVSDKCCVYLKEKPIEEWKKEHNKKYSILGLMAAEGGRRTSTVCLAFKYNGDLKSFHPLASISKEWEEWYINEYNIKICDIYKPPYNFRRTGCKGCPFNAKLQHELDIFEKFFPNERKQCEIIWKPVYDEYRRIGYRLKKEET